MDNKFIQIVQEIINKYGLKICDSTTLFNSLLADYAHGEYKRERRLLIWILETDCHHSISKEIDCNEWKANWIEKLYVDEFIDKQFASEMLDVIIDNIHGAPYYTERGFYLFEANNYDKALVSFDKALTIEPHKSEALLGKGKICLANKAYSDAIALFDFVINLNPLNINDIKNMRLQAHNEKEREVSIYLQKCHELLLLEKYNEAILLYDKVLSLNPVEKVSIQKAKMDIQSTKMKRANEYRICGLDSLKYKNYIEAIENFEKLLDISPEMMEEALKGKTEAGRLAIYEYVRCGDDLYVQRQYVDALSYYDKAINLNYKMNVVDENYIKMIQRVRQVCANK
jgi:tetratricopeptide (TPR) repeat protein